LRCLTPNCFLYRFKDAEVWPGREETAKLWIIKFAFRDAMLINAFGPKSGITHLIRAALWLLCAATVNAQSIDLNSPTPVVTNEIAGRIAPLDIGSKQALLEADGIASRADLLVQFMQFQRMLPGGADGPATLQ